MWLRIPAIPWSVGISLFHDFQPSHFSLTLSRTPWTRPVKPSYSWSLSTISYLILFHSKLCACIFIKTYQFILSNKIIHLIFGRPNSFIVRFAFYLSFTKTRIALCLKIGHFSLRRWTKWCDSWRLKQDERSVNGGARGTSGDRLTVSCKQPPTTSRHPIPEGGSPRLDKRKRTRNNSTRRYCSLTYFTHNDIWTHSK